MDYMTTKCIEKDCDREHYCKKRCSKHYAEHNKIFGSDRKNKPKPAKFFGHNQSFIDAEKGDTIL